MTKISTDKAQGERHCFRAWSLEALMGLPTD